MNRPAHACPEVRWTILFAMVAMCGPAISQQERMHTVQPGDNLYDLSQRYLEDPAQWKQLQRINQISHPRRLMPGSTLLIPAALARAQPTAAEVIHVAGPAGLQVDAAAASTPSANGKKASDATAAPANGNPNFAALRTASSLLSTRLV